MSLHDQADGKSKFQLQDGTYGVWGEGDMDWGIVGTSNRSAGVFGESDQYIGVWGQTEHGVYSAVYGTSSDIAAGLEWRALTSMARERACMAVAPMITASLALARTLA